MKPLGIGGNLKFLIFAIGILIVRQAGADDIQVACQINALQNTCTFTNTGNLSQSQCILAMMTNHKSNTKIDSIELCSGDLEAKSSKSLALAFKGGILPAAFCLGSNLEGSWDDCSLKVNESSSSGGWSTMLMWFAIAAILGLFQAKKKAVRPKSESELAS